MTSENKSKVDQVMSDIENPMLGKRYSDGTTDFSRAYLTMIWRMQDANGFKCINNPEWYKPKP